MFVCVGLARALGREVLLLLELNGVREQQVSCTYQGERVTDNKARMQDFLNVNSLSALLRSAFIKVVKWSDTGASRCCFFEGYCFIAANFGVACRPTVHLPSFLKSNTSFSWFPVISASRRAPHTLFLTVRSMCSRCSVKRCVSAKSSGSLICAREVAP